MPRSSRRLAGLVAVGALGLSALLTGCSGGSSAASNDANPDVIKFGVPPGEADPELLDRMQPAADLIAEATGKEVELTKTSDYLAIVEAMRSGLLDVALFSPMPTVLAEKVANVQTLAAALGAPYSTQIICRPDAGVNELADIQDHSFAFVDAGSTSGNYVPRLMLQRAGVDLDTLESTFAGGHDVAALSVKQGSTDCAAVASMLLPTLEESGTISKDDYEVIAESDPLPISTVVIAREGLDPEVTQQIADAFIESEDPAILEISQATEMVPADEADWTIFRDAADELGIDLEEVE
jgi:phosphonate transport system substrate-binding protein